VKIIFCGGLGRFLLRGAKVIDFHLKGCIVEQKCKISVTGRKFWHDVAKG
jgi:hypothetical protein